MLRPFNSFPMPFRLLSDEPSSPSGPSDNSGQIASSDNPETQPVAPEGEPEPYSDYDLTDEERQIAMNNRKILQDILEDPGAAAQALQFMQLGYRQSSTPKDDPKPEPKEQPKKDDKPDKPSSREEKLLAVIDELKNEIQGIKGRFEQEEQQKRTKQQVDEFTTALNGVLDDDDDLAEDNAERDFLKAAYVGHYWRDKPRNVRKHFADFVKTMKERDERQRQRGGRSYVESKHRTMRQTRGETSRGGAPGVEEQAVQPGDLDSGKLAERIMRKLGG
jgi:hypothetical protein